jgi:hypothetical protein
MGKSEAVFFFMLLPYKAWMDWMEINVPPVFQPRFCTAMDNAMIRSKNLQLQNRPKSNGVKYSPLRTLENSTLLHSFLICTRNKSIPFRPWQTEMCRSINATGTKAARASFELPCFLYLTGVKAGSVKWFAASELLEQMKDRTWVAKVTNAFNQHW